MAHIFHGNFLKLESEERKKILPVKKILSQLNIKNGSNIIDFGCGIGYFSIPAIDFVGKDGKVVAIDNSDVMIQELKKRAEHLKNIEIIKSDNIKGLKTDIILLINILHELDNPKVFLNNCFFNLNPNGRIVVIDWQKIESIIGPPLLHRISRDEIISMTSKKWIEYDIDKSLYFIEFKL